MEDYKFNTASSKSRVPCPTAGRSQGQSTRYEGGDLLPGLQTVGGERRWARITGLESLHSVSDIDASTYSQKPNHYSNHAHSLLSAFSGVTFFLSAEQKIPQSGRFSHREKLLPREAASEVKTMENKRYLVMQEQLCSRP